MSEITIHAKDIVNNTIHLDEPVSGDIVIKVQYDIMKDGSVIRTDNTNPTTVHNQIDK